jgi:hypothetical protein
MVTDAVNLILSNVIRKRYQLVVSPVHFREITDIPDAVERLQLQFLLTEIGVRPTININEVLPRAEYLFSKKFGSVENNRPNI